MCSPFGKENGYPPLMRCVPSLEIAIAYLLTKYSPIFENITTKKHPWLMMVPIVPLNSFNIKHDGNQLWTSWLMLLVAGLLVKINWHAKDMLKKQSHKQRPFAPHSSITASCGKSEPDHHPQGRVIEKVKNLYKRPPTPPKFNTAPENHFWEGHFSGANS